MATIIFSRPASFAIGPLRERLRRHLPRYRWQCGAADMGGSKDVGSFADAPLITGRGDDTLIFTELTVQDGHGTPSAPPHLWRLAIGRPTPAPDDLAARITLLIVTAAMAGDDEARCQLRPDGAWLSAAALAPVLDRVLAGVPLASALGAGAAGTPGRSPPSADPCENTGPALIRPGGLPAPAPRRSGFGRKGL